MYVYRNTARAPTPKATAHPKTPVYHLVSRLLGCYPGVLEVNCNTIVWKRIGTYHVGVLTRTTCGRVTAPGTAGGGGQWGAVSVIRAFCRNNSSELTCFLSHVHSTVGNTRMLVEKTLQGDWLGTAWRFTWTAPHAMIYSSRTVGLDIISS